MSFSTLYGAGPSDSWSKFSDDPIGAALDDLRRRFEVKDLVSYQSGHIFVSVRRLGTDDDWERTALIEFPGTYATTLPGPLAEIMERNLLELENKK